MLKKAINQRHLHMTIRYLLLSLVLVALLSLGLGVQPAQAKIACAFDYRVRLNDTLGKIAGRYAVKPVDIVRVNKMARPYSIYVGQTICIPNMAKSGFKDIESAYVNKAAAYFVAGWTKAGVSIKPSNFPQGNYFVKVDDATDSSLKWRKLGTLRTSKKSAGQVSFDLPREMQGLNSLNICLKDARNDTLVCNTLYRWASQSYAAAQRTQ